MLPRQGERKRTLQVEETTPEKGPSREGHVTRKKQKGQGGERRRGAQGEAGEAGEGRA